MTEVTISLIFLHCVSCEHSSESWLGYKNMLNVSTYILSFQSNLKTNKTINVMTWSHHKNWRWNKYNPPHDKNTTYGIMLSIYYVFYINNSKLIIMITGYDKVRNIGQFKLPSEEKKSYLNIFWRCILDFRLVRNCTFRKLWLW